MNPSSFHLPSTHPYTCSINTTIGIYQEGSAEAAAEALKNMLSSEALVRRNGKDVKVEADKLVPGDIVKLSLGDRVPADLRMCTVSNLSALEAALSCLRCGRCRKRMSG